ncbi:translocation and assembly module lipoprotein TamL [Flavitalea flava]
MFIQNMLHRRQVTVSFFNPAFVLSTVVLILLFSCTTPKNYQAGKPFVYNVDIKVDGKLKKNEKQDLTAKLTNQLDDSLRTQIVSYAGVYKKLQNPPVFDTANLRRSIGFMVALLNAEGYYSPVIKDSVRITVKKGRRLKLSNWYLFPIKMVSYNESRVSVSFRVNPGKQLKFDSIGYLLSTPELQELAMKNRNGALLQPGKPYSKQIVSAELDRLVDLFRDNGYYKFSKEDLVAVRDTVVAALIDPTLDPFQQAALLEDLKKKRENPTIRVVVEQRPVKDSIRITRFYIGHVTIFPDLPVLEDSTPYISHTDTSTAPKTTVISRYSKFKPSFLTKNVYLRPDRLYKQTNYTRTVNRFNQMGAWQQATIVLSQDYEKDTLLDVTVKLYPAKKQNMSVGVEASRNTNDIVTVSNLFGVGLNLGLRNRNTFKQSVLSTTSLRGGVELGADFIQTTQASISHSIYLPKVFPQPPKFLTDFFKIKFRRDSVRTVLNFNAAYTDRREFFTLKSVNTSWGFEWTKGNRSFLWRPLNIEYTKLDNTTDSFRHYLNTNPSLNLAFKSGLVIGHQFVYSSVRKKGITTNFLRMSGEESGAVIGLFKTLDEGDLWRYIKGDIEYRKHIDFKRSQLAFRAYAGAGWSYGREGNVWEETLPFYKAFVAGGPNSMRGWQVRQLGLGSSKLYDTLGGGHYNDRFGDVQLEGNIEYRFPLGTLFTIKLQSAFYVDAGNIWNRHLIDSMHNRDVGSDFKLNRFYKEFAVDAGTGLRLDFDYFLIRFDWAYKLKDPQRLKDSERWFYNLSLGSGQFQLGIGYPF